MSGGQATSSQSATPGDDWALPIVGLFLLVPVGAFLAFLLHREARANLFFVEAPCVVLDKRVHEDEPGLYRPEVLIRYAADGRDHEVWAYDAHRIWSAWRWPKERALEQFTVGQEYPCWYDPNDPAEVVVVRGYGWMTWALLTLFVVLVALIGKGALRRLLVTRRDADELVLRRQDVRVLAVEPAVPVEPPPEAPKSLPRRLASPLLFTLPFGLVAGFVLAASRDGTLWSGMVVGGLIGLAFGLLVGTEGWLEQRRRSRDVRA